MLRHNPSTAEFASDTEEAPHAEAERRVVNKAKPQGLDALRAEVQRKLAAQIDLGTPDPAPPKPEARPETPRPERRRVDTLRAEVQKNLTTRPGPKGFKPFRRGRLSPSRIALVFIALGAGGLAAYLATQNGQAAVTAPVVEPAPQVIAQAAMRVLVAKQTIGVGQRLSPGLLEWADWPEQAVRPEYITNAAAPNAIADMSGSVARVDVYTGEPIRREKLAPAGGGYLSAVLDKGKRAVSVSVAAESASGGFILPDDHVDVVLTRASNLGQDSQTILDNVRVLAINARLGQSGASGMPAADTGDGTGNVFTGQAIATLELDTTQAQVIINAATIGKLSLVLRPSADYADAAPSEESAINAAIRISSPFWTSDAGTRALK